MRTFKNHSSEWLNFFPDWMCNSSMQSHAPVYSHESSCSAFMNTLHWVPCAAIELMCFMIIQIVNTGIISSRWDFHTAFAEESVEHHPSAAGHTTRDRGAVRMILIIEINCILFQLIVPISLFSVMPFCNSVIWDAVRNWKCPNGQNTHQLKNFLISSLRRIYCKNEIFYRWNGWEVVFSTRPIFLSAITLFLLPKII